MASEFTEELEVLSLRRPSELEKRVERLEAYIRQQSRVNDLLLQHIKALDTAYGHHLIALHLQSSHLPVFRVQT